MDTEKIWEYVQLGIDKTVLYVPKIALAALILWLGFKLVKKLVKLIGRALDKAGLSETLRPFISSVSGVLLKAAILFITASVIGADLTGLITVLAAVAFAIGMALQGSLGNFASGILILTLQPYKVGDWIQLDDKFGKVNEIGIFSTDVLTPGNKILIIPNSLVTNAIVTNYSEKGMIRLELEISMPYEESFPKVQKIIMDAMLSIPKVLKDPPPEIGISNFDSHNVQLLVRPYVKSDDFWEVTFEANKAMKNTFNAHNIKVAYSEGIELGSVGE